MSEHPVKLVPGVADDGRVPFNMRMVEPLREDVYVNLADLLAYLRMVAIYPRDGMMSDVIHDLDLAREDVLK